MYDSKKWHLLMCANLSLLVASIILSSKAISFFALSTAWAYRIRTALVPNKKKISLSVSSKSYFQKTGQLWLYKKILFIEHYVFIALGCFMLLQDVVKAFE